MRVKISRFTLIEMLAVVAIASILIGLMVPAINRMMFGSRVDQCTSAFKLGMELAQAQAISARRYIAMLLPLDRASAAVDVKDYCHGGFRLAYVDKNVSTSGQVSFHFSEWVHEEHFRNKIDGAMLAHVFKELPDTGTKSLREAIAEDEQLKPAQNTNLAQISGVNILNGNLSSSSYGIVFSPFGGSADGSYETMYFLFTELEYSGNTPLRPTESQYNFQLLTLNKVTGKVEYCGEDELDKPHNKE